MSNKTIIIGCGTGRCGTVSLSVLLGKQNNIISTHEHILLPWIYDQDKIDTMMEDLDDRDADIVADTAFYYLPYTKHLLDRYKDNIKVICLRRRKEDVITSFVNKTEGRNHWYNDGVSAIIPKWNPSHPKFPRSESKDEAISKYWNLYYSVAGRLQSEYPDRFKIFSFEHILNTERGQIELARFVQIPRWEIHLDIVKNKSKR